MNKFTFAAIASVMLAAVATPAMANTNDKFTGVRAELTAGFNDITGVPDTNDVVYGGAIGVDVAVSDRVTLGVEGNVSNVFEDERQIGAAARVGYAFNQNFLGYARGGYTNYQDVFSRKLDGFVVGAGVQHTLSNNTYVKAEYNYSDFQAGAGSHGAKVGIGIRF